ncbi:multidrug resistance protein [Grosmannia clavigera kw1407]|uniref:Multidrug resistance protein n=1 Tax=Grosmannia clavigera (strain kw1407 / UAMH 11150) TaxID=655863 RepID=F0X786_GROCL|nr:multidrug resistance protein [Grosmannia clavigera kw1407]EFX06583.1 multidrug resistance protein [Grosmannia clavigera kw1407]
MAKTLDSGITALAPVSNLPDEWSPLLSTSERSANADRPISSSTAESLATNPSLLTDIEADAATPVTDGTITPRRNGAGNLTGSRSSISLSAVVHAVLVLMIGVFVSNVDGSLIMATHPIIASEFDALESSSWLFSGFILAAAATQTMYGKLSDIYGRKILVLISYIFFTAGCALVGAGQTMFQVILGRVISGAGSAGMTVLVSIIVSDLLPIRDVASWRSYINVVATTGRSLGGPVGGWLADVIGWRWSFFGQVPFMLLATILVMLFLPNHSRNYSGGQPLDSESSRGEISSWLRLRRVDFAGSALLALVLLALLIPMEIGGIKVSWTSPVIPGLFAASLVLFVAFLRIEKRAIEPIVPLGIFRVRDVNLSLLIQTLQTAAQLGIMFSVPLYFKVSQEVSSTVAGAHLFPAVAGNAIGGIITGLYIKKTGRYRNMTRLATISSSLSYFLLLLRWHGHTNWWEALYIFPGGFGTGVATSAVFISVQVVVEPIHLAPAISILYLGGTCASVLGLTSASMVMQAMLKVSLGRRLLDLGLDAFQRAEIVSKAVSNIGYVSGLMGPVKTAAVSAYIDGIWWSHSRYPSYWRDEISKLTNGSRVSAILNFGIDVLSSPGRKAST